MAIDPHIRFSRMSASFLRAFGDPEPITFTTAGDPVEVLAIVRSETDVMNSEHGGAGQLGEDAHIAVAAADASSLAEGNTFDHSGKTWRIADAGMKDGRAMVRFPIEVVAE